MPSPFATTKPWQDSALRLATKWATTGAPAPTDWDEWTRIVYEASKDRDKSGWRGIDRLWDDGFAAGSASHDEEIEDLKARAHDGP